ncbi:MAG TPA: patatin family protein [Candidatus Coprovivens excrementavium]|nr:patatin family protein [Candidatus Coprovivens excrementavium]
MKIGLVLEGGGMRGLYTAGILDAMLDKNFQVNGIIGVSAGALFGVSYVSKQRGRSLRYNQKYASDPRYMSFKSLITTGNFVNKDFAYYELPLKLDIFDEESFSKSKTDFYATVTNVETGKPEYLKIINATIQIEELRASSSLPFCSKIVKINDKLYLDGGISDAIPVNKCLEMGYDKVIVITTRPLNYRKTKSNQLLPKIFYHRYPNFVKAINTRYQRYNDTLDQLQELEKQNKIFVIRPSKLIKINRLEKNPDKMQEIYNLGLQDFQDNYQALQKYLKK